MITAKEIMTRDVITVSPEMGIAHAAKLLVEEDINGIPVVDKGELVGILCQSDLVAQQKRLPVPSLFTLLDGFIPLESTKKLEKAIQKIAATTVGEAMTPDPVTVTPETSIQDLAALMVDRNFHTIPVVDRGGLVGIIGKEDILKTVYSGFEKD